MSCQCLQRNIWLSFAGWPNITIIFTTPKAQVCPHCSWYSDHTVNQKLVGGFTTQLQNNSQIWWFPHVRVKIKNIWNHHPANYMSKFSWKTNSSYGHMEGSTPSSQFEDQPNFQTVEQWFHVDCLMWTKKKHLKVSVWAYDQNFLCGAIAIFLQIFTRWKVWMCSGTQCGLHNLVVTDSIVSSLAQTELLQKTRAIGHGSAQEQPTATNDKAAGMDGCDEESTLEMLTRSNTCRCVSK